MAHPSRTHYRLGLRNHQLSQTFGTLLQSTTDILRNARRSDVCSGDNGTVAQIFTRFTLAALHCTDDNPVSTVLVYL